VNVTVCSLSATRRRETETGVGVTADD